MYFLYKIGEHLGAMACTYYPETEAGRLLKSRNARPARATYLDTDSKQTNKEKKRLRSGRMKLRHLRETEDHHVK